MVISLDVYLSSSDHLAHFSRSKQTSNQAKFQRNSSSELLLHLQKQLTMAAPKAATVPELLERNKYAFFPSPVPLRISKSLTTLRIIASSHEPIPTFAELGAMGIDAPHTIIGPPLRAFPSKSPALTHSQ